MFFIGLGVAPRPPPLDAGNATAADEAVAMEEAPRADLAGWVRRARERSPTLVARNVDLLFRLGEGDEHVERKGGRGVGCRGVTEGGRKIYKRKGIDGRKSPPPLPVSLTKPCDTVDI